MCNRSNSLLKIQIVLSVLVVALCAPPRSPGRSLANTAIIKVRAAADAKGLCARYGVSLLDSIPELNMHLVTGVPAKLGKLRKSNDVLSMDDDLLTKISEMAILNESTVALLNPETVALLNQQGGLWDARQPDKSSILLQPALQKISLQQPQMLDGDRITVAVIDTGVDPFHEMLIGSTLAGRNFIDERSNTDELMDLDPATAALLLQGGGQAKLNEAVVALLNPSTVALLNPLAVALLSRSSPYIGHGTLVSGLIHMIAPRALIMPLKVFDGSGQGSSFLIAKAIVYAAVKGADVINMSFSLETVSPLVFDALNYAKKLVLVASIGNQDSRIKWNYPASYPKVIGIAATDLNDQKADFSNYGPAVDVSAPGEALISPYPGGLYAAWSGTSASAALVSGEAALLLSRWELNSEQVTRRILQGVDPLSNQYDLGKGRINLKSALDKR